MVSGLTDTVGTAYVASTGARAPQFSPTTAATPSKPIPAKYGTVSSAYLVSDQLTKVDASLGTGGCDLLFSSLGVEQHGKSRALVMVSFGASQFAMDLSHQRGNDLHTQTVGCRRIECLRQGPGHRRRLKRTQLPFGIVCRRTEIVPFAYLIELVINSLAMNPRGRALALGILRSAPSTQRDRSANSLDTISERSWLQLFKILLNSTLSSSSSVWRCDECAQALPHGRLPWSTEPLLRDFWFRGSAP